MCGIAGCILPEGSVPDESLLRLMGRSLAHRGPDDEGFEVLGQVGLVHRRLAVVDPSPAGRQPMCDSQRRWWLTYNGEIFNHASLRSKLPNVDWRSTTDTETLLNGLSAWGLDVIPRCNGFFSFAALDTVAKRLILVRDRFGIKPLYIAHHRGGLWFASEMGALLGAGIPRNPRLAALRQALASGWVSGTGTPFEQIECVAPGYVVTINLADLTVSHSCWYQPSDVVDTDRMQAAARRSRAELRGELETSLRTSVTRRLMADVPIGTLCSGGVDSSLVAAFAANERPAVIAYNASIADQPDADESKWARKVTTALNLKLRTVKVTADSWRRDLVAVVRHNEYPMRHESSVAMAQIAKLARADGVKVLLSGEGADELFAGYEGRHQSSYGGFVPRSQLRHDKMHNATAILAAIWKRRGRGALGALAGLVYQPPSTEPFEFLTEIDQDKKDSHFERQCRLSYAHHTGARAELEAALLADLSCFLPHLLNRQDKATMQHSVETRVPFLDPDVVAFALNLPLEHRVTPVRKGILRELASIHLPPGVSTRYKFGFGFDVRRYITDAAHPPFLENGYLRELLEIAREPWRCKIAALSRPYVLRFWTGEIWCRLLLDDQSVAAVETELWRHHSPARLN